MFSPKHFIGLVLTSLFFTSCAPFAPDFGKKVPVKPELPAASAKPKPKPKTASSSAASRKKKAARIKANKEAAARRAKLKKRKVAEKAKKSSSSTNREGSSRSKPSPPPRPKKPAVKPKSKYRTATSIPGKPGFVFNPWTNKAVDVRGIPGGSVVRDPNDGNPDHKFRVP